MFGGVGPAQVVKPGSSGDIPEDRAPVYVAGFSGSVNVVNELMVVCREVGRDMAVPLGKVASAVKQVLVVLPNPNDRGRFTHDTRSTRFGQADLIEPVLGSITTTRFVKPVTVEYGEVDLFSLFQSASNSIQHCRKSTYKECCL